MTESV